MTSWRSLAACAGTTVDFFPERTMRPGRHTRRADARYAAAVGLAVAVCETCPVSEACFEEARGRGEKCGIWGGVDWSESSRRRKQDRDRARIASGSSKVHGTHGCYCAGCRCAVCTDGEREYRASYRQASG